MTKQVKLAPDLSEAEREALLRIQSAKSLLLSDIPERTCRGSLGEILPGIGVYRKLERRGLVIFCYVETGADEFDWTPSVEIVEARG